MGLVSRTRERVDIPHEAGAWVELQLLTGPALESARQTKIKASIAMMEGYDLTKLSGLNTASPAEQSPYDLYDHPTLLQRSIVGWSYGDPVTTVDIEDVDARTVLWLVGCILDRNGLLETAAERKNGLARPTVRSKG